MKVEDRSGLYTSVASVADCAAFCTGTCQGYSYSTYFKECVTTDKALVEADLEDKSDSGTDLGWTHYNCETSTTTTTTASKPLKLNIPHEKKNVLD